MTEDDVREIVRDELARWQADRNARAVAALDQHRAALDEITAPAVDDGPIVTELKAIMRGEEPA